MDIIRNLPNNLNRNRLLNTSKQLSNNTIAIVQSNNRKQFINFEDTGYDRMIIDKADHYIIPYFNFKLQDRLLIIINGYSRSGKSVFLHNYILQNYKHQYVDRKIFYICPTDYKYDDSLKYEKMMFIDAMKFEISDDVIQRFAKSLVIVDDIDSVKNQDVWKLLSMLVNIGGKFNIDLIFITHANTVIVPSLKLNLVTDCDFYITYNIAQNRFFNNYNKDAPIDEFSQDTIITCRPKFKIIMSDKRIIKY